MNLVEELKWRGMIHNIMPDTEAFLKKNTISGYVGIDPTADSLHIGHLVSIMMLKHLQLSGQKPLVVLGGATGMIGDPSGKSQERNLLTEEDIAFNQSKIKKQLGAFLDYDHPVHGAEILNNYEWMKTFSFIDFIRDIGKHITINYMCSKESVKKRVETGLSFTEFSYQLVQGYDFLHLYQNKNCRIQMGGSDQWGNITTGTELIRRTEGGKAFALTCPLITKSDGGKFGKTESGNIWLDPEKTSPYKFYQFWINSSDEDSKKWIRIFTLLSKEEIETLEKKHHQAPHLRILQQKLAQEITTLVHSQSAYESVVSASKILFGKSDMSDLKRLTNQEIKEVFEGVPKYEISRKEVDNHIPIIDLLSLKTSISSSKGEARRSLNEKAISINKEKIGIDKIICPSDLIHNQYIIVQKGKKKYFLLHIV